MARTAPQWTKLPKFPLWSPGQYPVQNEGGETQWTHSENAIFQTNPRSQPIFSLRTCIIRRQVSVAVRDVFRSQGRIPFWRAQGMKLLSELALAALAFVGLATLGHSTMGQALPAADSAATAVASVDENDVQRLADKIDEFIVQRWKA